METLNENGAAIQDSGTKADDTLIALKKAIEDANAELSLIIDDITAKAEQLESIDAKISAKAAELGILNGDIASKKVELGTLTEEVAEAKADLEVLSTAYDSKAKQIALQAPAQDVQIRENLSVKFVLPSFNLNGQTYISKDVEAAIANEEAWAMDIAIELHDMKSGVIEAVKKGGE